MRSICFAFLASAFVRYASAVGVTGAAEGFAKGVTGGASAALVYPTTNAELVSYLGDCSPRVIILTKTFDFRGTEGTTTETGCAPWGTGSGCQTAINQNNWCTNYQPGAPKVSVSYDKAATLGITVKSNKSLVGQGSSGVIIGKGLRIVSGASNVIIQNIKITNLNPQYVWGGDAITLDNTDLVWIDHVTTSLIGRQHIVLGNNPSNRVTISNNYIDGRTSWSATCDGYHYWNLYFTGSNDLVTFKGNYIHHISGRAPKVGGNTLLHAVNNYFYQSSGHIFEVDSGAKILAEGNVFQNAGKMVDNTISGQIFTSPSPGANSACSTYLGHACQLNAYGSTTSYTGTDTNFFQYFKGKNIAAADTASTAQSNVPNKAGHGKI
ncbi:pectin lyase fold/virulence factor [Xylaria bambusicola]|uniref:pectin lyase fold/virulence factor n=1 Tax=Xylaria bambusicola TaxID=326684 RepID=UPI0020083C2D|nr:pectin lyase fold/virulence factor [Xylaria bambusicola]KAI0509329.1 pectin lyase fold/virulence factor [Xylaria bambusicola]